MTAARAGAVPGQARTVEELARLRGGVTPTPEQAAVIGGPVGPVLVKAGAGSGKTQTLSMRMVYLLDHAQQLFGAPMGPDEILCLTFTRKAAAEIADRAAAQIEAAFGPDPERADAAVSTYNAYAAGLVAEHGLRVGVDPDSVVLTDAALWQLAATIVESWADDLSIDKAPSSVTSAVPALAKALADHGASSRDVTALCTAIADAIEQMPSTEKTQPGKPTGTMLAAAARFRDRAALAPLVEAFRAAKAERSLLDFSDQVAIAGRLARLRAVQAAERSKYRVVLLDEFQDTSDAQLSLFADIFGTDFPVEAVGDPNQAIYGFRGASANSLAHFVDRFGGQGVVRQESLTISWRNEAGVLAAANVVADPLRVGAKVSVPLLRSRGEYTGEGEPGRDFPNVTACMYQAAADEAAAVVAGLTARRDSLQRAWDKAGKPRVATAAILCRTKAQFGPIVEQLRAAGVRFEVVGLGGLLDVPEVVEAVALLEAAHDPGRGDSLMRLLTSERFAIGARDLASLQEWAEQAAGPRDERDVPPSIVDAIATLPREGWASSREGREITAAARERLRVLARLVEDVRRHAYLPVPELVTFAVRALGLDIEVAVRDGEHGARSLDALVDTARSFATAADHATLGGFLAYLDAARDEENGLDAPAPTSSEDTVKVQTIHTAKGLEWDVVAVPGVVDGKLPNVDVPTQHKPYRRDGGWLEGIGSLPWPLRLDREDLPVWDWEGATNFKEFSQSESEYRRAAGVHKVAEERRLFYVALTRARSHVIVSGAWWSDRKSPHLMSPYLEELVQAGVAQPDVWVDAPDPAERREPEPPAPVEWPVAPGPVHAARAEFAAVVDAASPAEAGAHPLAADVEAMLTERSARAGGAASASMPAHLSSTALVALARDRDAFALSLRRPVPVEPTLAAERGSAFHAWIEEHYGHGALLNDDDFLPGPAVPLGDLQQAFLASPWAQRSPTHIEVDVELPIAGVTLRSRIDAVFPAGAGLDRVTVVDWKSGREPRDDDERHAREIQLAVYRLAWATWRSIPVEDVDAAFFYAATGQTATPERLLTEPEIVALITGEPPAAG